MFVDCHECWPGIEILLIDVVASDRWRHDHFEMKYHENNNFN